MKGMLTGLGLAGLLCLPCLLIGGVVSLALIGGTLGAVATNPLVQLAGLALIAIAAALLWRARRRAACEIDPPLVDAQAVAPAAPSMTSRRR